MKKLVYEVLETYFKSEIANTMIFDNNSIFIILKDNTKLKICIHSI